LDQIHPKGLPLATVTAVDPRGELYKIVRARPRVDMSRLEEVLVILEPAAPHEQPEPPKPPVPSD